MFKKQGLVVLLVGAVALTLAGCSLKSSRRFIEGKAAELSKVYPTETSFRMGLVFLATIFMIIKKGKVIFINLLN